MRLLACTLAVTAFLFAGCSSRVVEVVDPTGAPVAGAQVIGASPSMNTETTITNAKGQATVPDNIPGVKRIQVSKPGLQPSHVEVPASWPLRVTLTPEPRP